MRLYVFYVLLTVSQVVLAQSNNTHKVQIIQSEINIDGETNVNKFRCGLVQMQPTDQLRVESKKTDLNISFDGLCFSFDVTDFDCGLSAMTDDFRSILNYQYFPKLKLSVDRVTILQSSTGFDLLDVIADVSVEIAGMKRDYKVTNAHIYNKTDSRMVLIGTKKINMTDFGLNPPVRFWGALKVDEHLQIQFKIEMSAEPI
jgi:hypothetical protein